MTDLKDIVDVGRLQTMVSDLWNLLDDIDTLDDACRSNDEVFRNLTRAEQQKRHQILASDGYSLSLPRGEK